MNFEEAEKYITSLLKFGINLELDRVESYFRESDYPWNTIKFIHVGGTNGKGSTAAMIASILEQAGCRVGLYSSPHINDYCERISINGENISREAFSKIVAEIASSMNNVSKEQQLTEFELLTVLAFEYFRRERVDAAVIEVGLGGRFDATNVIPCTQVSVITNVSKDHMQYLGESELEIAAEKAGIIKAGGCLITAEESPEVRRLFLDKCIESRSSFYFVEDEVEWQQGELTITPRSFSQRCNIKSAAFDLDNLSLRMLGRHQVSNAATALLAAQILMEKGFPVLPGHVRKGLEGVSMPGRFEIFYTNPLVVMDAAHNVEGTVALKETLNQVAGDRKLVLVTGVLDDKERDMIGQVWGGLPERVVVTRPESGRSTAWEQLAPSFSRYIENICLIEDISEAVSRGWELTGNNGILCITGSFYLLKRARQTLQTLI